MVDGEQPRRAPCFEADELEANMTTKAGVALSRLSSSHDAGVAAAAEAMGKLGGADADIVFVFASPSHEYAPLLKGIRSVTGSARVVGCSAAGAFTGAEVAHDAVTVMAIKSDSIRFVVGMGRSLKASPQRAVAEAMRSYTTEYRAARGAGFTNSTCIVLSDGLAGQGEDIVDAVHATAGGLAQVVGGAAADDAKFVRTDVFLDDQHYTDAIVIIATFSKTPIGIGVRHGLTPACPSMIVTRASENIVHEIDGRPALTAYEKFAQSQGDPFGPDTRDSYMMVHEIGMLTADGDYKIRAPLRANAEGGIVMASEVPAGSSVAIMSGTDQRLISASEGAARSAATNLGSGKPAAVLVFDCICRRIFLGDDYKRQVEAFGAVIGARVPLIGWETYGEIALTPGQQSGWHNSTSVVAVLPD